MGQLVHLFAALVLFEDEDCTAAERLLLPLRGEDLQLVGFESAQVFAISKIGCSTIHLEALANVALV